METPNILYQPSIDLPRDPKKTEAAHYKGKMAMEAFALVPVVGRVASFTSGYLQLKALNRQLAAAKGWQDRILTIGSMGKTAGMIGLSVISPKAGAVVSGFLGSFSHMSEFVSHMEKGEIPSAALDAFRTGTSVVYMWAMISGNPVYIALSLVAQGSEGIVEGASMLIKQWDEKEKDWTVIGLATLQIGLGGLRASQGVSICSNHLIKQTEKPQESRLLEWGNIEDGEFELTPEHLERINACADDLEDLKITYVKYKDRKLSEVHFEPKELNEFTEDLNSQVKWRFIDKKNLSIHQQYKILDVNDVDVEELCGGALPPLTPQPSTTVTETGFAWERPESTACSIKHFSTSVDEDNNYHVQSTVDDHRLIRDLKGWLSGGIKLATNNAIHVDYDNQDEAAARFKKFSKLNSELNSEYKTAWNTAFKWEW